MGEKAAVYARVSTDEQASRQTELSTTFDRLRQRGLVRDA